MPHDEELLQVIKSQRAGTQRQAKRNAQQVVLLTSEEEESNKEDTEEEGSAKEKSQEQVHVQKDHTSGTKTNTYWIYPWPKRTKKETML